MAGVQYLYKYIFADGETYVGSEGYSLFKRATDHFAEALKALDPQYYQTYFTIFGFKIGNEFNNEFLGAKFNEQGEFEYLDKQQKLQNLSIKWAEMVDPNPHTKLKDVIKNEGLSLKHEFEQYRYKTAKGIQKLFNDKNNQDLFSEDVRKRNEFRRRYKIEEAEKSSKLYQDMSKLQDKLVGWYYWDCNPFISMLRNTVAIPELTFTISTSEDGKEQTKTKTIKNISYIQFLNIYIGKNIRHALEELVSIDVLAYVMQNPKGSFDQILNNKIGDQIISQETYKIIKNKEDPSYDLGQITLDYFARDKKVLNKEINSTLKAWLKGQNNITGKAKIDVQVGFDKLQVWQKFYTLLNQNLKWKQDKGTMFKVVYSNLLVLMNKEKVMNL